jgi:deoxyribodipyrimidine photo-lyase
MSNKKYKKSLFVFRRDLRLQDNTALIKALEDSDEVICIFIMTPTQLTTKNKYKSENAIQFMHESLDELQNNIKNKGGILYYFYAEPHSIISKLNIDAVFLNSDYTPYAIERDLKIKNECLKNNINFHIYHDDLLYEVGSIRTGSNNDIYKKFTPFFNRAKKFKIKEPKRNNYSNYYKGKLKDVVNLSKLNEFYKKNNNINVSGGRKNALKILRNIKEWNNYNKNRNFLDYETTHLSAYIKFGCVSIREVYYNLKKKLSSNNDLFKQLHWRDFYYNIAFGFPHVFNGSMKKDYDNIKWENDKKLFEKWKKGETGFPIVDAGMRELNITGYMHNRTR